MSLLLRVIYAAHCRSTHHKLAIDALQDLRCPGPQRWRDMFLQHHEDYLTGAKDPDTKFKDFRNHVLHVEQNNWGGAIKKTREWYGRTVDALKHRDWADAAYCAGVMSHYYTDPIMPFHTAQSVAENNIHRATEWSICKSYDQLRRIAVEEVGLPELEIPSGSDWLEAMVIDGATRSHRYYNALIKQYDFAVGRKDPPAGLNKNCRRMLAELLGHAAIGLACILDEAIEEADVRAPRSDLTVATFLATVKMPVRWITKKMADIEERALVESMFQEYEETGKVEKTLPDDDRAVRELVTKELGAEESTRSGDFQSPQVSEPVEEVEQRPELTIEPSILPLPEVRVPEVNEEVVEDVPDVEDDLEVAKPQAAINDVVDDVEEDVVEDEVIDEDCDETSSHELRFYLERASDVVDAPSIGPKTAKRLNKIGVKTVDDLLNVDADVAVAQMDTRHITPDLVVAWQDQARLACCIPQIRGHDAQILVACGYVDVEDVAAADIRELLGETQAFAATTLGERIIRSGKAPDHAEVSHWIEWARQARPLRAA